ncbi:DUF3892 domain-containing protein [Deltaproteobacteria bacterium TL4]
MEWLKGTVKNYSSVPLWVVETDNGKAIAHLLATKRKSPKHTDADGFKRVDGKSIYDHASWWKIYSGTTADIYDYGNGLTINISIMRRVPENQFEEVTYDSSEDWGEPMKYVTDVKKGKTGAIEKYFVEEIGWLPKSETVALAEQGQIDNAVVVHSSSGPAYLRSRPDQKKSNNFSEMAKA